MQPPVYIYTAASGQHGSLSMMVNVLDEVERESVCSPDSQ